MSDLGDRSIDGIGPRGMTLGVVPDATTGLYHGTVYRNAQTPSGCVRLVLAQTTTEGFPSPRDAAAAINAAYPSLERLDTSPIVDDALPAGGYPIPSRALVTRITARRGKPMEEGQPPVEVTMGAGRPLDIAIAAGQFDRMVALGHLALESTSGADPGLYYRYDHYVLTGAGRAFHAERVTA